MRIATVIRITLVAVLATGAVAHAQWKWRDESGQINYSDQPPPKGVPASRILSSVEPRAGATPTPLPSSASAPVGGIPSVNATAPRADAAGAAAAAKADPAPRADAASKSAADRALEAKLREKERELADRKREEEEQKTAARSRACEAMRADMRTLESGMRIARVNPQGEREFLTDDERAQRIEALRRDMRSLCTTS